MLMNTIDFMKRVFLKIKRFVKNQKCIACDAPNSISPKKILLSAEQKSELYITAPKLFFAVNLTLEKALASRVTLNYKRCSKCGAKFNLHCQTDAWDFAGYSDTVANRHFRH